MGQIQNKTYTAPDGSVYRVEDDGSITKIKGGMIQSNEPPSKYQITPEGKIYRVEIDGSVTYLGNAEEKQSPQLNKAQISDIPKERSRMWIWIIILLVLGGLGAIAFFSIKEYDKQSNTDSRSFSVGDNLYTEPIETHKTSDNSSSLDYTNAHFSKKTIFYGETSSEKRTVTYYSDGRCELYAWGLSDEINDHWMKATSEGTYYVENGIIHVVWDEWVNEEYALRGNYYQDQADDVVMKLISE